LGCNGPTEPAIGARDEREAAVEALVGRKRTDGLSRLAHLPETLQCRGNGIPHCLLTLVLTLSLTLLPAPFRALTLVRRVRPAGFNRFSPAAATTPPRPVCPVSTRMRAPSPEFEF